MSHQANRHQRTCLNQTNSPVCVHPLTRKGYAQFLSGTSFHPLHCIQTWRIISGFASSIWTPMFSLRITYTHYSQVSFAQMHIIIPFLGCQMLAFYYIPRGRDHSFLKSILILLSYRYIYICPCCYLKKPFHYQFYLYWSYLLFKQGLSWECVTI